MISVDALLFDLDGTLIDSTQDLAGSVRMLQKEFGFARSRNPQIAAFVGDGVVKLVQRSLPGLSSPRLAKAVQRFKEHYRQHCLDHTRVYPGVVETLEHFRHKKMAVVTNKPVRVSGYILDHLGLSPFFQLVIGGDSLPHKKPHPEPVLNAMRTLRVLDPRRVVVVGDSANDIAAGSAAGTRTCGVRSNIGNPKKMAKSGPDFSVQSLKDLMRIFN